MPRGGKRSGAGRRSSWPSGWGREQTKLIRVPIALADELLDIARRLDAGESIRFEPSQQLSLSSVQVISSQPLTPVESEPVCDIDFSDADGPLSLREAAARVGCAAATLQDWKTKLSPSELATKTLMKSGKRRVAISFQDGKYYAKRIGNTI